MVGPILAFLALAVFTVPFLLMLYFVIRYVADVIPRREPDDRPHEPRPAAANARPGDDGRVRGDRGTGGRGSAGRVPSGGGAGCRMCGHSVAHHEDGPRGGCVWKRPGWRYERVFRDDDWHTGWIDERRWHDGAPCGCPAYIGPEAD